MKNKMFFLDWRGVIFWVCWFLVETITSGTCLNSYEMIKTETSRCSKVTKLTYCILSTLIFLLCHRKEIKLKFTISFFQGVKVNLYRKLILSSIQKSENSVQIELQMRVYIDLIKSSFIFSQWSLVFVC